MSFWDSLFGGGMEESGRTESTEDSSSSTTLDPRYQQSVYGATDQAANAFSGKLNQLDPNQYVAGSNPDLDAAWAGIRGMQAPGEFGQASDLFNRAAGFQAGNFAAPEAYGAPQAFGNFGLQSLNIPRNFSAEDAKQYMNPYTEAVTEQARQQAIREGSRQAAQDQMQAVFGAGPSSSGAALKAAFANQNMANTIADITARGNAAAFDQGRQQFNTDIDRRLGAEQFNIGAGERAYGLNQATAAQNEAARARAYGLNADTALNAFKANEDARQFAANLGLSSAQGLGALGTARQAADLQRYNARAAAGDYQRNMDKEKFAIKLQQALKNQDISRTDAAQLMQLLAATQHGTSSTGRKTGTSREFSQTPSIMGQLGGLAGAAASMYLGAPMMMGNQGVGSIGGLFDKANNFWGFGGDNGDMLTDMSSSDYTGYNPRGSNGFRMNG